jgi:hypothetical protein
VPCSRSSTEKVCLICRHCHLPSLCMSMLYCLVQSYCRPVASPLPFQPLPDTWDSATVVHHSWIQARYTNSYINGFCVESVSTIRDVSSHRHPTGRPAACPRRLWARDGDGWSRSAPPTVTSPGVPARKESTDRESGASDRQTHGFTATPSALRGTAADWNGHSTSVDASSKA